jgi:hypothetical protein
MHKPFVTTPPSSPIMMAAHGGTNPDPGVMTTSPATTPEQNERPLFNMSSQNIITDTIYALLPDNFFNTM